jgi:hypothetical protein
MNKKKILLFIILLLSIPTIALAKGGGEDVTFSPLMALGLEAFITIHMSLFVFKPLADMIPNYDSKTIFWTLFIIRALFLLIFDFFVTPWIVIGDFIFVFIGAFVIVPLTKSMTKGMSQKTSNSNKIEPIQIEQVANTTGYSFTGANNGIQDNRVMLTPASFDKVFSLKDDQMIEEIIKRELAKAGLDPKTKQIPSDVAKRKMILNIIFAVLVFVSISSIFIHFPIYVYLLELLVLTVFFIVTRKYSLIKYLKKQVKARPGEKVSNIVMNTKSTLVRDRSIIALLLALIHAIALPLVIFATPKIIYEKTEGGYAVRYYIYGLTNATTAEIPETYNNEKVVSLRGNTFSNMFFLEKVTLPDTVTEIRGQAFKNCISLKEVNIPKNLQYLGGGSFAGAISIKRIDLPDTLTELGGEAFQGASSLEYVRLSNNITEIRGNTFEDCESLKEITIPDNVTRIGGHAFYGNTSLAQVNISTNSKLQEIGSSAFRNCDALKEISLPNATEVNSKAFKGSPTKIKRYSTTLLNPNNTYNKYNNYNTTNTTSTYNMYQYNNSYINADVTFEN